MFNSFLMFKMVAAIMWAVAIFALKVWILHKGSGDQVVVHEDVHHEHHYENDDHYDHVPVDDWSSYSRKDYAHNLAYREQKPTPSSGEARQQKRKKKKQQMERINMFVMLVALATKVNLILHMLSVAILGKLLIIGVAHLILTKIKFFANLKNSSQGTNKVVYFHDNHHDHHYEDLGNVDSGWFGNY
ncbi:hypothetical protein GWI33_021225 [Rhynchophorus ferrugineus]|uniref:Uncharacterized protein n=1 Tax=Rhynchophorus ferrugineus TaxID=354439 RepID=A0A834M507_RHYFE|nr:hypothetical protein GWI33_021225 [Rhynchophorus ferrugineus]